ncbi:MAG: trypsin-like peptidase domain-containing protein, partial [Planctomycetes bacterium]|nr:trypsin-like peptidase domain-containing protein [Planctomycetota bacterium]
SGRARPLAELAHELDQEIAVRLPAPPAAATAPLDAAEIYRRRIPGVLLVTRVYKCQRCPNWHHSGSSTGFVLTADGLCATCRHVFEGEEEGMMVAATCDGRAYAITQIVASSKIDDIALFRVEARGLRPIPLRSGAPVGSDIWVISHPHHCHFLLTDGILARRAEKTGGILGNRADFGDTATPVINITADYGSGSSGAPVLDRFGNAIGMVSLTTAVRADGKKTSDPQMTIHTCVPAERILRLFDRSASQPAK